MTGRPDTLLDTLPTTPTQIEVGSMVDMDLSELTLLSLEATDALFASLKAPMPGELSGAYRGRVLAAAGVELSARWFRRILYFVVNHLPFIWNGKAFQGNMGSNTWFTSNGAFQAIRYRSEGIVSAADGTGLVSRIDYDIEDNLSFVRPMSSESRKLRGETYLCRMFYGDHRVLYFSLGPEHRDLPVPSGSGTDVG